MNRDKRRLSFSCLEVGVLFNRPKFLALIMLMLCCLLGKCGTVDGHIILRHNKVKNSDDL